ncbi:MAG: trypsin-like peptidase domain-containing protein [Candidatus Hydrogenedentes bacterium]|nr:trypsin-like peptidase domain-containing protein [Candidatus Hydrogenedentota bacterium]
MCRTSGKFGVVILSAMVIAISSFGDDTATAGRAVIEQYKDAVVTVKLVIKMKLAMPGGPSQEDESKAEITGTVIDPSGLTVVSLSTTDPFSIYRVTMGDAGEEADRMQSDLSDVKITLSDGTELPAKVVLRDKDWDLAFIRPLKKLDAPTAAVDLAQAASPQILDEVLVLNRLGRVASRVNAAGVGRIEGIVAKPRTFYIPNQGLGRQTLGAPLFSLDGKVLGIAVLRAIRTEGSSGRFGRGSEGIMSIVLPAGDVLETAKQAPQPEDVPATPEEPTPSPAPEATPVPVPAPTGETEPPAPAPTPEPAPTPPAETAPPAPAPQG